MNKDVALFDEYRTLNQSFKKSLVYHLGGEAGFFSEYNNMILAMLYCLDHKIKFSLYSDDANFRFEKGWQDFFLPFCEESHDSFHSKYNHRQPLRQINFRYTWKRFRYRKKNNLNYLSSDIWPRFRSKRFRNNTFNFPSLSINGNILHACSKLVEFTWRFNTETKNEVINVANSVNMPSRYLGLHIRRGDKESEFSQIEEDKYMQIAIDKSEIKDAFVLTDDYRVIVKLKKDYQDWNFYSLCDESERGYVNNDFVKSDLVTKRAHLIKLFASIYLLSKSELFIGTFSSNPDMFLAMAMGLEKVHSVDFEKWIIY